MQKFQMNDYIYMQESSFCLVEQTVQDIIIIIIIIIIIRLRSEQYLSFLNWQLADKHATGSMRRKVGMICMLHVLLLAANCRGHWKGKTFLVTTNVR